MYVVKQKQVIQVAALATSCNHLKILNILVIMMFAIVLAFLFLPFNAVHDAEEIHTTNGQDKMRNLHADLLSRMHTLSSDQGLQIQGLYNTLNVLQLQIVSESELVAKLHKNICVVNQTTLSIVNDVKAHYDCKIKELSTLVTELSSKVDSLIDDQVLQLQKLAGIEEDLNVLRNNHSKRLDDIKRDISVTTLENKSLELVTKLHESISDVDETALVSISELKVAQQILLHCISGYQFQKELTIKALQLDTVGH